MPLAPEVIVIQDGALLAAVQADEAVTAIVPFPAEALKFCEPGEIDEDVGASAQFVVY